MTEGKKVMSDEGQSARKTGGRQDSREGRGRGERQDIGGKK